jgi:hypothetical protein
VLGRETVEHLLSELPPEVLASRPEELYLEDFATISNLATRPGAGIGPA